MAKFVVVCRWEEIGEFEVEADSLEQAIEKVYEDDEKYCVGNADGEYIDDSFKIHKGECSEIKD